LEEELGGNWPLSGDGARNLDGEAPADRAGEEATAARDGDCLPKPPNTESAAARSAAAADGEWNPPNARGEPSERSSGSFGTSALPGAQLLGSASKLKLACGSRSSGAGTCASPASSSATAGGGDGVALAALTVAPSWKAVAFLHYQECKSMACALGLYALHNWMPGPLSAVG
jgi:hypothetical protein